ncbi:hypothetical protein DH2020_031161 [Rehmannia glutinosa]|uniref:Uncharacterized protein n=1 Tax=Rehmannia glutinosa TaxID=99300 RepID=A0ABR0VIT4_REHGL
MGADWGPVVVAVVMFIVLSPGLLFQLPARTRVIEFATALFAFLSPGLVFQLPGKHRPVDFLNMKTSVPAMVIHTVIYGLLLVLFLIVLNIHIYA